MEQRSIKSFIFIILSYIFIYMLFASGCGKPESLEAPAPKSIIPVEHFLKGMDVFLLIDQSGSMSVGSRATDPEGIRVRAAKWFVDYLGENATEKSKHRISVINFGDEPITEEHYIPLTDIIDPVSREKLKAKIVASNLGDTSFIQALEKVKDIYHASDGQKQNRQPVIIIFTDGEPDDDRKLSVDEYFREIKSFVTSNFTNSSFHFPQFQVFVIGIDVAGVYWDKDKPYWEEIAPDGAFFARSSDRKELTRTYRRILQTLLGVREEEEKMVEPGRIVEVELGPYLERVNFSVWPRETGGEEETVLAIERPDGREVDPKEDADVNFAPTNLYDIYSIIDPEPGIWKYKIVKGRGIVDVARDVIPIQARIIQPQSPYPLGKPVQLHITFFKRDGSEVVEKPAYPLWFGASISSPKEIEKQPISLEEKTHGYFIGLQEIPTDKTGDYIISLTVKGGTVPIFELDKIISVRDIPYPKIITPKSEAYAIFHPFFFWKTQSQKVEVQLTQGEKAIAATSVFEDDPDSIMVAQIRTQPDGKKGKAIRLTADRLGQRFTGSISGLGQPGEYLLAVELAGKLKATGTRYEAPAQWVVFSRVAGMGKYTKYIALAMPLIIIVSVLIWWSVAIGLPNQRPKGRITILCQGASKNSHSLGKRRVYKIGKGCKIPLEPVSQGEGENKQIIDDIKGEVARIVLYSEKETDFETGKEKKVGKVGIFTSLSTESKRPEYPEEPTPLSSGIPVPITVTYQIRYEGSTES